MTCGTCKNRMQGITAWRKHRAETGCHWQRPVWEKVVAARGRGSSGRRLLAQAYPHLFATAPMSEEAKERLRELGEKRKGMEHGRKAQKRARRRTR